MCDQFPDRFYIAKNNQGRACVARTVIAWTGRFMKAALRTSETTRRPDEGAPDPPQPAGWTPPDLFALVPPDLFRPLAGQYASLYWSVLACYYHYKFEGSPADLPRGLAVDHAEELLVVSKAWRERRADLSASLDDLPEMLPAGTDEAAERWSLARRLVLRLQQCGWFYFEAYRETSEVLNFYPYAARLLAQMMGLARDEQPVLRGYAHAVASMLRPDEFARSPGVAIANVRGQTLEFARELRILHGYIREAVKRLFVEHITTAEVLYEALERYGDQVRRNYHLLKTRDNVFAWRAEILSRLDEIEQQVLHLEEAVRWYAEQDGVSLERAHERVREDLHQIRSHIEAMPGVMREIDERNQHFSGVATRRVAYLMRHDARIEGQLQFLLDELGARQIPGLELDIYRAEFFGPGFLYTPPSGYCPFTTSRFVRRPGGTSGHSTRLSQRASGHRIGKNKSFGSCCRP